VSHHPLLGVLANLGAGALLGWVALPLFARLSWPRFAHDPASSHRALVLALVLAALLMLVPWLRPLVPHRSFAVDLAMPPDAGRPPSALLHTTSPRPSSIAELGLYLFGAMGVAWSLGTAVAGLLACLSVVRLAHLIRRSRPAPTAVHALLERRASGRTRACRVLVSEEASVPFAAIPWAPALVLPAAFLATFDQRALDLVFEHETAHLERGDLWISALVRAVRVLFPFHPAAARLADEIAFAREAAVDARVSAVDPHAYATLLLEVAAHARFDQPPRPVSMDETALERRIVMLTDGGGRCTHSAAALTITAAVLAILALAAPPVLALPVSASLADGSGTWVDHRGAAVRTARTRRPGTVMEPVLPDAPTVPDEAYASCLARQVGEDCSLPAADGQAQEGTCRQDQGARRFCHPVSTRAPEQALVACASRAPGDSCAMRFSDDLQVVGSCRSGPDGRLFCASLLP
jgi:beta-lactamase regulating signal transducer with metallopeptidase domain